MLLLEEFKVEEQLIIKKYKCKKIFVFKKFILKESRINYVCSKQRYIFRRIFR